MALLTNAQRANQALFTFGRWQEENNVIIADTSDCSGLSHGMKGPKVAVMKS